jgi:hypothetical protein
LRPPKPSRFETFVKRLQEIEDERERKELEKVNAAYRKEGEERNTPNA